MTRKNLIVSLITDDLVNQKLMNSFRELGIDLDLYQLDLSTTIFELMEIKRTDDDSLVDQYMKLTEISKEIPVDAGRKVFRDKAIDIYRFLEML